MVTCTACSGSGKAHSIFDFCSAEPPCDGLGVCDWCRGSGIDYDYFQRLAAVVIAALEEFDDSRECSCPEPNFGACWYHLGDEERARRRLEYVAEALRAEL